ncbi:MAG: hypothetical protein AUF67_06165 [Acidobacteria bacterium 13_1_20CM_58_21]|nr:MAG: hypothetical protein AUF67_06165 [Acidobacteria bacterium 13_1_20CM_58_21]
MGCPNQRTISAPHRIDLCAFFSPLDYGGEAAIPSKNHLSYALTQTRDANPTEVSQGSQGVRNRGEVFLWRIIETDGCVGEIELIARKKPLLQAAKTAWKYEPIAFDRVRFNPTQLLTSPFKYQTRIKEIRLVVAHPQN